MTFVILHDDPHVGFQPIAESHVVCVYIVLLFILAVLRRYQVVAICPEGIKRKKKKNIWSNGMSKMVFSCLR